MQTDIENLTQELFGFLITEKGFRLGRTEHSGLSTTYTYKHKTANVGVSVHLDFRDETIDLYLLKLDDGKLPEFGGFGGTGGMCHSSCATTCTSRTSNWIHCSRCTTQGKHVTISSMPISYGRCAMWLPDILTCSSNSC